MTGLLAKEIKQRVPFSSLEIEAFLNIQRTADRLRRHLVDTLRPHGLSPAGYNVLRILRGAGPDGLPCHEVSERLVAHDPDVTRLADRLAQAGLLERARRPGDRRVVVLAITAAGLDLLAGLGPDLEALHRRLLGHLGDERLATLIGLLEEARTATTPPPPENP